MDEPQGRFKVTDVTSTVWNPKVPMLKLQAVESGDEATVAKIVGVIQLAITDPEVMKRLMEQVKVGQTFQIDPVLVDQPEEKEPVAA